MSRCHARTLVFVLTATLVSLASPAAAASRPASDRPTAADGVWSRLSDVSAVSPRWGQAGIYDPLRDRFVVYGGYLGTYLSDVLADPYSGSQMWDSLVTAGTRPPGRVGHAAAYDPVRDRMLVFGGLTASGASNEVWALALGDSVPTWSNLLPAGPGPAGRFMPTMTYDPAGDRMVVFGGTSYDPSQKYHGEVWTLSLGPSPAWTKLVADSVSIPGREGPTAVYDAVNARLVVYGGATSTSLYGDVRALPLTGPPVWQQLAASGTQPGGAYDHQAIYDPTSQRMITTGGLGDGGRIRTETWALSLAAGAEAWTRLLDGSGTPPATYQAAYAFDSLRHRMLVQSGLPNVNTTGFYLDLDPDGQWTVGPTSTAVPLARTQHTLVRDSRRNELVLFGGYTGGPASYAQDVWIWSPAQNAWRFLRPAGTPPSWRAGHVAVYDSLGDRMIVWGGGTDTASDITVYALSLGSVPAWSTLAVAGSAPSARSYAGATLDPARHRMLVYGGLGGSSNVWSLSLDAGQEAWSTLPVTGGPGDSYKPVLVYDPLRDRLVVGGAGVSNTQPLWTLSLTPGSETWQQLDVAGDPPYWSAPNTGVYDPVHDRVIFAGFDQLQYGFGAPHPANDTTTVALASTAAPTPIVTEALWLSGTPTWTQLQPTGEIAPIREYPTAVYDPQNAAVLLYGGDQAGCCLLGDLRRLSIDAVASFQPDLQSLSSGELAGDGATRIQLRGVNFFPGCTVTLTSPGLPPLPVQVVSASAWSVWCTTVLPPDWPAATYTVTLTNPTGEADSLVAALAVVHGPTVRIETPNGGESWAVASKQTIRWHARPGDNALASHSVWLSIDGGSWFTYLATVTAPESTYLWTVPEQYVSANRIRVTATDAHGNVAADTSDANFLTSWTTDVQSVTPTIAGASRALALGIDGGGFSLPVTVWLSRAGLPPLYASTATANAGHITAQFALDAATGPQTVVVRNGTGLIDSLVGALTLVPPPQVTLLAPNGGEVFTHGAALPVSWNASSSEGLDSLVAEFSSDGGVTYPYRLGRAQATDGAFTAVAPDVATQSGRVRVTAYDVHGVSTADVSDGAVSIVLPPDIVALGASRLGVGSLATLGITGTQFYAGATVSLLSPTLPTITATSVLVTSSTQLTANLDLGTAGIGPRTVVVRNPGGGADSLAGVLILVNPPRVTVLAPNGGEVLSTHSAMQLRWSARDSADVIDHVTLALSLDGGVTYPVTIGVVAASESTLSWVPNTVPSSFGRVRATAVNAHGVSGSDASDANFTLSNLTSPVLARIAPASGEVGDSLSFGLGGSGFTTSGVSVYLERLGTRRYASVIDYVAADSIHCGLRLAGLSAGAWDVVLQNTDGQLSRLVAAFAVMAAPDLQAVVPEVVGVGRPVTLTLLGANFTPDASVWLSLRNKPLLLASSVTLIDAQSLAVQFDLTNAVASTRTVVFQSAAGTRDSLVGGLGLVNRPVVHLLAANGGEVLPLGALAAFSWSVVPGDGEVDHLDIQLSRDGGLSFPEMLVAGLPPDAESAGWTATGPATGTARLRVTAYDLDGVDGSDDSDANFQIGDLTAASAPPPAPQHLALRATTAAQAATAPLALVLDAPRAGTVELAAYDVRGQRAGTARVSVAAGRAALRVTLRGADGRTLPAGVYHLVATLPSGEAAHARIALLR